MSNGGWSDVYSYFLQYLDFSNIVKLFALNVPICLEYLWYLYATLYVYAIFYVATIFYVKDKVLFVISVSIVLLQILLGEALSIFGIILPGLIMRNFAVMGISFFALGLFIEKHQHKFLVTPNYVILLLLIY